MNEDETGERRGGQVAPAVVVESLTKRFGALVAVDDLSFALEPGTITGFLGPNGAGKTTTLRMLLGLAAPSSGSALIFGRAYAQLDEPALRVGAVLEATDFHTGRSGRDHLRTLSRAVRLPDARVDEVLRLVELDGAAHRRVKGYSLGMRQRLGLAAALLGDPELLILDEPANGLDPEGVRWLRDFLRAFAAGKRTVLVSSHVLAEVAQTVDQVLIINHGRLVVESSLAQLTARVGGSVRVRTPERAKLEQALGRERIETTTVPEASLAYLSHLQACSIIRDQLRWVQNGHNIRVSSDNIHHTHWTQIRGGTEFERVTPTCRAAGHCS
jgi:ABC-2 type transport system ATP-binding protein